MRFKQTFTRLAGKIKLLADKYKYEFKTRFLNFIRNNLVIQYKNPNTTFKQYAKLADFITFNLAITYNRKQRKKEEK